MDGSLTLQYAIIGLLVLISAWVVLKKQFPGTVRKARVALFDGLYARSQRIPLSAAAGNRWTTLASYGFFVGWVLARVV